MAACGEAEHADFVGVEVPISGMEADQADGALGVVESFGDRG